MFISSLHLLSCPFSLSLPHFFMIPPSPSSSFFHFHLHFLPMHCLKITYRVIDSPCPYDLQPVPHLHHIIPSIRDKSYAGVCRWRGIQRFGLRIIFSTFIHKYRIFDIILPEWWPMLSSEHHSTHKSVLMLYTNTQFSYDHHRIYYDDYDWNIKK